MKVVSIFFFANYDVICNRSFHIPCSRKRTVIKSNIQSQMKPNLEGISWYEMHNFAFMIWNPNYLIQTFKVLQLTGVLSDGKVCPAHLSLLTPKHPRFFKYYKNNRIHLDSFLNVLVSNCKMERPNWLVHFSNRFVLQRFVCAVHVWSASLSCMLWVQIRDQASCSCYSRNQNPSLHLVGSLLLFWCLISIDYHWVLEFSS